MKILLSLVSISVFLFGLWRSRQALCKHDDIYDTTVSSEGQVIARVRCLKCLRVSSGIELTTGKPLVTR